MTSKVIFIYKICPEQDWRSAVQKGVFTGTQIDIEDGFIHFSPPEEVATTAAKYFAGQDGLVLVRFPVASLTAALKWEASRDNILFPHFYAPLDPRLSDRVWSLRLNGRKHIFPEDMT
ncbi:MAG: DUF952 domain-containing protein, partial [Pseudomonadota bacterium]|nr:DUF952 domain-containing protein [Pseudomonadota bacterium]